MDKSSLEDSYSQIFDHIDLNELYDEMDTIKSALANDSLNLSDEEKINLQNELELISNIFNEKVKLVSSSGGDGSGELVSSSGGDGSGELVSSSGGDGSGELVSSSDETICFNDSIELNSIDGLVLDENASNVNSDKKSVSNFKDSLSLIDVDSEKNTNYHENMNADISVDEALDDLIEDYSNDIAIKVDNVSMDFDISMDKIDTLKEFFIRTVKRNKSPTKTVHALKNISFEIPKGDRVGIIGFNGAGKSTLLKLLSRVFYPTAGTIETNGNIAPLLELGAGFDDNYTGKDNIFLNGAFLGCSEDFIKEKYDEIVEFSELGDAINYHVKTYSSGMRAKLGFSIATIVEPDILIIDEILSVGDIRFQRKSSDKIRSLINSGITVLLVSHSVGQIRELCNKAIWIDDGELKMMGEVNKICDAYVKAADEASNEQLKNIELN